MPRLNGKIALITGAGTGIGRATARAMAAEGARIVVAEINAASGEQTARMVTGHVYPVDSGLTISRTALTNRRRQPPRSRS
jgi:NAD(P)-dependent dehydrogenase (short-subunit alcohol dehydrogenase family)